MFERVGLRRRLWAYENIISNGSVFTSRNKVSGSLAGCGRRVEILMTRYAPHWWKGPYLCSSLSLVECHKERKLKRAEGQLDYLLNQNLFIETVGTNRDRSIVPPRSLHKHIPGHMFLSMAILISETLRKRSQTHNEGPWRSYDSKRNCSWGE
jgi:hypothetical protein